MTAPLRVGAMFAGYGGLDLGLGMVLRTEVEWVAEIEPSAAKVLAARFPHAPNLGDVTAVDWRAVPPVDVLTGGSPCQDLSKVGRRRGMRPGTRSGLWAAMADAIDVLRPRLVVWENVRGALSARAVSGVEPCPFCLGDPEDVVTLRALGRVLGDLAELGYDTEWISVRAADVGAPHERIRVFLLAWPAPADADGELPGPHPRDLGGEPSAPDRARPPGYGPARDRSGLPARGAPATRVDPAAWGDYAAAVDLWARVTGQPAPAPTDDLDVVTEWTMGLPRGWVTDVPDLSPTARLRILGNGVVPQQAAHAIRTMLERRAAA